MSNNKEVERLQLVVAKQLDEIRKLESDLYFNIRNNKIENNMMKSNFDKVVTSLNQLLQEDKDNDFLKQVLIDIGVRPNE